MHRQGVQFGKGVEQPGQRNQTGIHSKVNLAATSQTQQQALGLHQIAKPRRLYDQKFRHVITINQLMGLSQLIAASIRKTANCA